jgi:hypothetical protein
MIYTVALVGFSAGFLGGNKGDPRDHAMARSLGFRGMQCSALSTTDGCTLQPHRVDR